MENQATSNPSTLESNPGVAPPAEVPASTPPAASAGNEPTLEQNEQLAAMQEQLEAMKAEVESARRHSRQKEEEARRLKRQNLSDPEALAALEQELEAAEQQRQAEYEAKMAELAIQSNSFDVKQTLADAGVSSADCTKLAAFITSADATESTARAKALVSVINKVASAKAKEATNAMLQENADEPKNGSTPSDPKQPAVSAGAQAVQAYNERLKTLGGKT